MSTLVPMNLMRPNFRGLFLFAVCLLIALNSKAQICTGSLGAPVINETFGSGSNPIGPQLPPGVTNYLYVGDGCGAEDGQYAINSSMRSPSCKGGTWQTIAQDHTGDANGYFMIINASYDPGVFYTERVAGNKLCPNTTYEFGAWIMNILRDIPQTQGFSKPNITFRIEKTDGTLLKSYNTGDINSTIEPRWYKYGTFFTSPADGSDVVVKMINNGKGGNGNDLAMDDITFSPCGPVIETGFGVVGDISVRTSCVNDNLQYTLVARQTGYDTPSYQWQQNLNDGKGWTDITGATSTRLDVTINKATARNYQYRIGVLNGSQTGSENCRIYSDPLSAMVYPFPVVNVANAISGCTGQPLRLSSTGGGNSNYEWSGPNGFTATGDSPLVTENATKSYNGVYTLKITANGCPSFAKTTVTVYDKASIAPLKDAVICAGSSIQLNAAATNATHYKWSPAAGLNRTDIANPIATPTVTTLYRVEVRNDGCPDIAPTAQATVTVLNNPVANAGVNFNMSEGQTAQLKGTATGDSITQVYWSPPDFLDNPQSLTPHTRATDDITYTLHVISAMCGESTSSVFVRVFKKLSIPNAFSPNNDGINDLWDINNLSTYPKALLTIYGRNGQPVYQSNGSSNPWDGKYSGSVLPAGVYYYVIDLKESEVAKISGWVFLVR